MTIPLRSFGKTNAKVSALGFGGHHLGQANSLAEAVDLVHAAIDGGITFFDNCWEYHNGKSEDWMGEALAGKRDRVFLMTKVCTHGREAALAMKMLEQSLRRLRTDHLDLWQVHGLGFDNDPELAYRAGGVLEALDRAKRQGKTRFVGFTGHKSADVHFDLVRRGYAWDAVQMPLNCFDATFRSFEQKVLPALVERGIAALGMKPLTGKGEPITKGLVSAEEMLRYAMSLPGVTVTITGMESRERLAQNLKIAQNFVPMGPEDLATVREKSRPLAADGRYELYKVSLKFDNPEARRAHDFPVDAQQMEIKEELEYATGKGSAK